jgi:hypothetical protein
MPLHHSIAIVCIVGLVNCLARLQTFCIFEAEHLNFNETLSQQLSIDVQHMMESRNGYVGLQKTDNDEVVPSELLDTVDPFIDVPSNLLRNHK